MSSSYCRPYDFKIDICTFPYKSTLTFGVSQLQGPAMPLSFHNLCAISPIFKEESLKRLKAWDNAPCFSLPLLFCLITFFFNSRKILRVKYIFFKSLKILRQNIFSSNLVKYCEQSHRMGIPWDERSPKTKARSPLLLHKH